MSTLGRTWHGLWQRFRPDQEPPETFESGEWWTRAALRLVIVFALLFGGVFFAFWWAGSAVRFSAARAGDRSLPTWQVSGTVRDALTHQPIPWAVVEDNPGGPPPFFRTDAGYGGDYELLTLAEPHRVRVSAPGYHPVTVDVGRAWFVWMPRGKEKKNIDLLPLRSWSPPKCGGSTLLTATREKPHSSKFTSKMCCVQHLRMLDSSWSN
jgi:hypothetical protein